MRLLPILLPAVLSLVTCAAGAACNGSDGCPDSATVIPASAELAKAAPIQVAELPAGVVSALAPREGAAAPARVASAVTEGRAAGNLVMRSDDGRSAARATKTERGRTEQGAPEPSVWLMVLAGLAFAGFIVAKRSRG
jgi:hypothetical protein